jgi:hypothetical protein
MRAIQITTILFALMSLALPGIANAFVLCTADTVDVVYDSFGANDIITIWGGTNDGDNVYAGVYMLNKTSGSGEGKIWPNSLIGSFCIELQEHAPYENHTYILDTPDEIYNSFLGTTLGKAKADYLSELWGRFFDPVWMSGGPYSSKQDKYAEAFAAAIWKIVYEDLPKSSADDKSTAGCWRYV